MHRYPICLLHIIAFSKSPEVCDVLSKIIFFLNIFFFRLICCPFPASNVQRTDFIYMYTHWFMYRLFAREIALSDAV